LTTSVIFKGFATPESLVFQFRLTFPFLWIYLESFVGRAFPPLPAALINARSNIAKSDSRKLNSTFLNSAPWWIMIRFICPGCSSKLKIKALAQGKSHSCPRCGAKLNFSGTPDVPVVSLKLENQPKLLGKEASWVDVEFEETTSNSQKHFNPPPANRAESPAASPGNDMASDLLYDEYEWERERQKRNRIVVGSLIAVGAIFVGGLGILVLKAKSAEREKAIAGAEHERQKPSPPTRRLEIDNAQMNDRPSSFPPAGTRGTSNGGSNPAAPPVLDVPVPEEHAVARPIIPKSEIARDHEVVLQFVKVKIFPKGVREIHWKGPWDAERDEKRGKLYRMRGLATVLGDDFRQRDALVAYFFFVFDDRVTQWQKDPGDLAKLTICTVTDSEPFGSPDSPDNSTENANESKRETGMGPLVESRSLKVPGYKVLTVEGFKVLVSELVLTHNSDSEFARKPMDILGSEIAEIVRILPPRCIRILRKVPIWVEWHDEADPDVSRGVIAKYYGVSGNYRVWSLGHNKNPLKANCVEVVSLKRIAQSRQRTDSPNQAVILHELAHAVHIKLFGSNNVAIRQAYQQAVDRKLYEDSDGPNGTPRTQYARTNDHEYFAELSCAYFDRLGYFPRTRVDLRKYDPAGFRVMELTWGKARIE
jgi:hypothetical protein